MLCVSIKNNKSDVVIAEMKKYEFVEIRLDDFRFSDSELKAIFGQKTCKTIATCRNSEISDQEKLGLLKKAISEGADLVDVEIDYSLKNELIEFARDFDCKIIASIHYFDGEPDFDEILCKAKIAKNMNAEYFKIACRTDSPDATAHLLYLYLEPKLIELFDGKLLAMPFGENTEYQRFMTLNLGAPFMYVSPDDAEPTALGQMKYLEAVCRINEKEKHDKEHIHDEHVCGCR